MSILEQVEVMLYNKFFCGVTAHWGSPVLNQWDFKLEKDAPVLDTDISAYLPL